MPPIEIADLWQYAVLWEVAGIDGYNEPITSPPVEISVRWTEGDTQSGGATGGTQPTDGTVIVKQLVYVGSLLWLGRLSEWYGTGSAGDDTQVMEVISSRVTPDLKNRNTRWELGVRLFRDTLPAET